MKESVSQEEQSLNSLVRVVCERENILKGIMKMSSLFLSQQPATSSPVGPKPNRDGKLYTQTSPITISRMISQKVSQMTLPLVKIFPIFLYFSLTTCINKTVNFALQNV